MRQIGKDQLKKKFPNEFFYKSIHLFINKKWPEKL